MLCNTKPYRNQFAAYYDKIYEKKNYLEEVLFVEEVIKLYQIERHKCQDAKILLDVGSGTGTHCILFSSRNNFSSSDYSVFGLEPSKDMYEISIIKLRNIKNRNVIFINKNVEEFVKDKYKYHGNIKCEVITSLFHVINHIHNKDDLERYFSSVRKLLCKDGLFVFDCWNYEEVLKEAPKVRKTHHVCSDGTGIGVELNPNFDCEKEIVELNMKINISKESNSNEFNNNLRLKMWNNNLICDMLREQNMNIVKMCPAFELNRDYSGSYKIVFVVGG